MKKVNLFFWAIIFALNLIILPFSAIAAEEANDASLEEVTRSIAVKKCKGTIDEDKFIEFINYAKYAETTGDYCYDCKTGIVLEGQRGKCNVTIRKDGPGFYIVK
jgi:hypothetical protein